MTLDEFTNYTHHWDTTADIHTHNGLHGTTIPIGGHQLTIMNRGKHIHWSLSPDHGGMNQTPEQAFHAINDAITTTRKGQH